ncbi:MAG: class I SAM-dependent methyltransferase [Microthrixaceae bacterium]|nr:class I SAM-dependent methyltransferase [Microthrixaceae bacterium]
MIAQDPVEREYERLGPGIPLAEAWAADLAGTMFGRHFLGLLTIQNPLDTQMILEIIWETRPEVIVECGSFRGGSALMWASHLEACEIDGRVIAIDVDDNMDEARQRPLWGRRVTFFHGSSTAPEIIEQVIELCAGKRTMVLLDSDHHAEHVAAELAAYASLVTEGCYLLVQDTLTEKLVTDYGPGPLAAVEEFIATDDRFVVDRDRERLILTMLPSGWLRRV